MAMGWAFAFCAARLANVMRGRGRGVADERGRVFTTPARWSWVASARLQYSVVDQAGRADLCGHSEQRGIADAVQFVEVLRRTQFEVLGLDAGIRELSARSGEHRVGARLAACDDRFGGIQGTVQGGGAEARVGI